VGILGNIGGIERLGPGGVEVRYALEALERAVLELSRTSSTIVRNNVQLITINNTTVTATLPAHVQFSYPFPVSASAHLFPDGVLVLAGSGFKVTSAEIVSDPISGPASAATSFTIQNALTSPTSSGTVTIPSGSRTGRTQSLAITFLAGQKLYIKAPAALNKIQNLYRIDIGLESL